MPDDLPSRLRAMAGPIVPNVCTEAADEIERLTRERDDLLERIKGASIVLYESDCYYDPKTSKGNAPMLAEIVEEAYALLQGASWRKPNGVNQNG